MVGKLWSALWSECQKPSTKGRLLNLFLEPAPGFEPGACCLRNSCSAAELRRHKEARAPLPAHAYDTKSASCGQAPLPGRGRRQWVSVRSHAQRPAAGSRHLLRHVHLDGCPGGQWSSLNASGSPPAAPVQTSRAIAAVERATEPAPIRPPEAAGRSAARSPVAGARPPAQPAAGLCCRRPWLPSGSGGCRRT